MHIEEHEVFQQCVFGQSFNWLMTMERCSGFNECYSQSKQISNSYLPLTYVKRFRTINFPVYLAAVESIAL